MINILKIFYLNTLYLIPGGWSCEESTDRDGNIRVVFKL